MAVLAAELQILWYRLPSLGCGGAEERPHRLNETLLFRLEWKRETLF